MSSSPPSKSRSEAEKRRERAHTLSQRQCGAYQLGDVIGRGSQGDVCKGLNRHTGDIVAIKQVPLDRVNKDVLDSAMMEIELMRKLDHPNIVRYIDTVRTPDSLAIVLEYVEGGALSGVVRKFGSLPESLVRMYTRQILHGLAYLHKQGVIHRDIKGANLLVTKDGEVKLADFGVASRLTKSGLPQDSPDNVVGTPYWMAPEIIELSGVTSACDVWSVGCTVIELLTGAPPYFDLQPMPALFRIVQDDHPPLPAIQGTSVHLEDFLLQCFQKEPNLRVSAQQLLKHPWLRDENRESGLRESEGSNPTPIRPRSAVPDSLRLQKSQLKEMQKRNLEKRESKIILAIASGPGEPLEEDNPELLARRSQSIQDIKRKMRELEENVSHLPPTPRGGSERSLAGVQEDDEDEEAIREAMVKEGARKDDAAIAEEVEHELKSPAQFPADKRDSFEPRRSGSSPHPARLHLPASVSSHHARKEEAKKDDDDDDDDPFALVDDDEEEGDDEGEDEHEHDDEFVAGEGAAAAGVVPVQPSPPNHNKQRDGGKRPKGEDRREDKKGEGKERDELLREGGGGGGGDGGFGDDDDEGFDDLDVNPQALRHPPRPKAVESDSDSDPFANILDGDSDGEEAALYSQLSNFTKEQLQQLRLRDQPEDVYVRACNEILQLLRDHASVKSIVVSQHGLLPLKSLLRSCSPSSALCLAVLRLISKMIEGASQTYCELLCLEGFIAPLSALTHDDVPPPTRHLAVYFIWKLCYVSESTLGMCVSCGGLDLFPMLVAAPWDQWRKIVRMAIQCLWRVFEVEMAIPKSDLCHELVEGGVLPHLTHLLFVLSEDQGDDAPVLLLRVSALLIAFANADDDDVRDAMVHPQVLQDINAALGSGQFDDATTLSLLKCVKVLCMNPHALGPLQRAGLVTTLVHCLHHYVTVVPSKEHQNQLLNALFHLCSLNRSRQEEAAVAGIVPHLQAFIATNSPHKQFALPIICEFALSNNRCREVLWENNSVEFLLSLLYQEYWQVKALEALAVWLAEEQERVEPILLEPRNLRTLIDLFDHHQNSYFQNLLDPFMSLLTTSPKLRQAVGLTSILPKIMEWLTHPNPSVRLLLFKIIHSLFEAMSRDRQRFTAYHMEPLVLVSMRNEEALLVREMGGKVLADFEIVKQRPS